MKLVGSKGVHSRRFSEPTELWWVTGIECQLNLTSCFLRHPFSKQIVRSIWTHTLRNTHSVHTLSIYTLGTASIGLGDARCCFKLSRNIKENVDEIPAARTGC